MAASIELFLLTSKTLARKKKNKESTLLASDDEFYDVYEIETLYINVICGSLGDVFACEFEDSFLEFYEDELIECGSERNVTIVQLVNFYPALDC